MWKPPCSWHGWKMTLRCLKTDFRRLLCSTACLATSISRDVQSKSHLKETTKIATPKLACITRKYSSILTLIQRALFHEKNYVRAQTKRKRAIRHQIYQKAPVRGQKWEILTAKSGSCSCWSSILMPEVSIGRLGSSKRLWTDMILFEHKMPYLFRGVHQRGTVCVKYHVIF